MELTGNIDYITSPPTIYQPINLYLAKPYSLKRHLILIGKNEDKELSIFVAGCANS